MCNSYFLFWHSLCNESSLFQNSDTKENILDLQKMINRGLLLIYKRCLHVRMLKNELILYALKKLLKLNLHTFSRVLQFDPKYTCVLLTHLTEV